MVNIFNQTIISTYAANYFKNFLNLGLPVHASTTVLKITSFTFHPSSAFLSEYFS